MLSSSLLPFLTLLSPITSLSLPVITNIQQQEQQQQQPLPNSANIHTSLNFKTHFRDIQSKDIPAITTILVEAFSPSATWHYLMPDLAHHKPEVWACLHAQTEHAWRTRNKTSTFGKIITVVLPPSSKAKPQNTETEAEAEEETETPVSFSLWSIRHRQARDQHSSSPPSHPLSLFSFLSPSSSSSSTSDSSPCPLPPGTNLTRATLFSAQTAAIERTYFTTPYAHQLYLNLLATHPSWDGHGFGARHVRWGQKLSQNLSLESESELELGSDMPGLTPLPLPVTLLASPAGYPLYDSLGFESVVNATMEMLDGLGELWFEVMRWGWVGEVR